ncbi:MAG: asparagine synthase (glutamine-hydrolyzing) [Actinomycetota bacterium]|nr:asparagine synthase (glutamine-hydrolyzing) [Actinomycetota bacterium]
MLDRLGHRGPDDRGDMTIGQAWLGHTRLSIVDVVGGHQPMTMKDHRVAIVANGEIYNHRDLRADLDRAQEDRPVTWQTVSDSEVALHVIDRDGPAGLAKLRGMFALAFSDGQDRFLLARDPVGIKPLYWAHHDGTVVAASELKAFDPALRPWVESFPPGHYWTPDEGLVRFATAVPDRVRRPVDRPARSDAEDLEEIRNVLVTAVDRRMMGDVPVGCFLSGGLDSSIIAAIAARWAQRRGQRLQTFAVGTPDSADVAAARVVAENLGTDHHEVSLSPEENLDVVPEVVRSIEHFDPSLVRSAVANYVLAELAARHVKVVLTGEGADELFGGYEYLHEGDYDHPEHLHAELVRSVEELHGLNLQRCDRVTMAHGLEARVPFLDVDVIEAVLAIPPALKVPTGGRMEKDLLRRAFEGWIPDSILWRTKAQFGDGSGAASVRVTVGDSVKLSDFDLERGAIEPPLRTREEVAYHRIWASALAPTRPEATLFRFATA